MVYRQSFYKIVVFKYNRADVSDEYIPTANLN